MMREHDDEPIPGLPERLPAGERILWQGAPAWRPLAERVFHLRLLAVYAVGIVAVRVVFGIADGVEPTALALSAAATALVLAVGIGLFAVLAWMMARTTLYTITNRRLVIRFGMALPMTINIPFRIVEAAALKPGPRGTGDVALALGGRDKIAYLHLWPHVRPWHLVRPEPMLRAVPEAALVARLLADALRASDAPVALTVSRTREANRAPAEAAMFAAD